ncbi:MAG: 4Fe-4S dicluster domain-containing protein [Planctomycetaceae bacterium]|nr:4Fe-4S dicluster domain-containing protein [Planctomycetaceae bacterium]
MPDVPATDARILQADRLDRLFEALIARGYHCVGPTLGEGAIVYDEISGSTDLPRGWTDEQAPGQYRLKKRNDGAYFGYVVGPHSWKKYLFEPQRRLWQLKRAGQRFERTDEPPEPKRYAFIGVRACEIAALRIQDRVFAGGSFVEPGYAKTREQSLVIAVNCTQAAATCFCVAMNTGPEVREGFDLALTEILEPSHHFLIQAGSERGRELLSALPTAPCTAELQQAAKTAVAQASQQTRTMETAGLKELLQKNLESPQWQDIATRCLSCANCTMACPTCFCSSVEDTSDLTGDHAERWQRWDSCFNPDFSYIHGGEVRKTTASRYRQWMTHKLSTWFDQFGSSGCVGCGRCITWCPVGIDLTEEVRKMTQPEGGRA